MRFREIFQFELKYQLRHLSTWIYFAIPIMFLLLLSLTVKPEDDELYFNAPFKIISISIFAGLLWLLAAGSIAGHAATRDLQTRLYPLTFTSPVSKLDYLGGRLLAAFVLNVSIQLTIPLFILLIIYFPGITHEHLGPFRIAPYLSTFFFLALPNTFIVTSFQFCAAILQRRAIASYMASVLLFPVISHFFAMGSAQLFGNWDLWKLIDLAGISIIGSMDQWTPFEKNTRVITLEGMLFWNRLLWMMITLALLAFTYSRFQFVHAVQRTWWSRFKRKHHTRVHANSDGTVIERTSITVPGVLATFGFTTQLRQLTAIASSSFRMILKHKVGLAVTGLFTLHLLVFGKSYLAIMGVPRYPTAANVLPILTASLGTPGTPLMIFPVLIAFYAGELVWREREAGLNKITDTFPVSEWTILLGKFLGLGCIIILWLSILLAAGVFIQLLEGYTHLGTIVFLKALFGFQFVDYLLFALLALVVHVLVDQKYLGHLVILCIYSYIVFASKLGIEHNLLIYGADPGWSYTDMRGFEPNIVPWLWFKLYWTSWAVLIAVVGRLFWVRSLSQGIRMRIQLIRHRLTRSTVVTSAVAIVLMLFAGAYIFYNTNILNAYSSLSSRRTQQGGYEKQYRKYKDIQQPRLTKTKLHIELYPEQLNADVRGTYHLINDSKTPIDTIHLTIAPGVETGPATFGVAATLALEDNDLGYRIYALDKPLAPGDSLSLNFEVWYRSTGFLNTGKNTSVIPNGTHVISNDWLPAIGYQANRELRNTSERKKVGLAPRVIVSPYDTTADEIMRARELIDLEVVVGTDKGQTAITAGKLQRKWNEKDRAYFQYATSAPINNKYSFYSANYGLLESNWTDPSDSSGRNVAINLHYHPEHTENIERMLQSAEASLRYYTAKFGPYPYGHLTIVERSGFGGLHAEASVIDFGEPLPMSNLRDNPTALDIVYFGISHEVAHQWWGPAQLMPANVEGEVLLSETLANYSGQQVLQETYGVEQTRQLLSMWRNTYELPRSRVSHPLLQADDDFLGYRKGPLAMNALAQYIGTGRVNDALRQLLLKDGSSSGSPSQPTSLDLYRELNAVTPDSLGYLLQDYFEKNLYWQLKTTQANAKQIGPESWQLTLKIEAKKMIVDSNGTEIQVPIDDWIEIGALAPWETGQRYGKPLYLQKHHIRSVDAKADEHTIVVTVSGKPSRAGIDPNNLLIDLDVDNNTRRVKFE